MKSPQGLPGFSGVLNTGMVRVLIINNDHNFDDLIVIWWWCHYYYYDHEDDDDDDDDDDDCAKVMVACLYIGIGFFGYLKFGPDVEPVSQYQHHHHQHHHHQHHHHQHHHHHHRHNHHHHHHHHNHNNHHHHHNHHLNLPQIVTLSLPAGEAMAVSAKISITAALFLTYPLQVLILSLSQRLFIISSALIIEYFTQQCATTGLQDSNQLC